LAKTGQKVVVLEQHYVAGGCTHEFEEKGFTFDSGVHYVGKISKYGKLLDIVTEEKIKWAQMGSKEDGYCYDEIVVDEKPFRFRSGRENLIADLKNEFPQEHEAIDRYFALVDQANRSGSLPFMVKICPLWVHQIVYRFFASTFLRFNETSLHDVLTSLTQNKRLIAILEGQFGDHGLAPKDAPFFLHAGVFAHYFEGGFYPVGGTQAISRAIIPTILKAGGKVFVKAAVSEIIIEPHLNRVMGVRLAKSGDILQAKCVVSAAGIRNTFSKLIKWENLAQTKPITTLLDNYKNIVEQKLGASSAHFCTFIGFDQSAKALGLTASNTWVLPCKDVDYDLTKMMRDYHADPLHAPCLAFISFPSVKDPKQTEAHPNQSTCCIITEGQISWFDQKFAGLKSGKRGESYQAEKKKYEARLLQVLYQLYPKVKGHIKYIDTSTPLTSAFYLGSPSGESYGLSMKKERYQEQGSILTRPKVEQIQGLFLTGSDLVSAGFVGGLIGGMLTAHAVLGYGSLWDLITQRNLIYDMIYANKLNHFKND